MQQKDIIMYFLLELIKKNFFLILKNPVLDFENEQKLLGVGGGDLSIGGMDGGEHFFFLQTLLRRTYEIESAYLGI